MPSQLASVPLKIRLTSRPNGQCPKSNEFPTLGGATVAAPRFPKEGGGQANSFFFGGGGDLVFTSHHTTMQKIKDFNDLGVFLYKNEEI